MSHTYENGVALSPTSVSPQHIPSNQNALSSSNINITPNSNAANANSMMCFAQLQDDANHKHCSTGNQKALLSENLHRLGKLTKELEETDWMFDSATMTDGGTGADSAAPRGHHGIGLEERHFSFGRRLWWAKGERFYREARAVDHNFVMCLFSSWGKFYAESPLERKYHAITRVLARYSRKYRVKGVRSWEHLLEEAYALLRIIFC